MAQKIEFNEQNMNKGFLIAIIVLVSASCKTREKTEILPDTTCKQTGIVLDFTGLDGCKFLIYGGDGVIYEPVNIPDSNFVFVHGARINYDLVPVNAGSFCMVGTPANITCLSKTDSVVCQDFIPYLKMVDSLDSEGNGHFKILRHSIGKGLLTLEIGYSGCSAERKFEFNVSKFAMKSLPPIRMAALTFEPQSCLAYFTRKICIDVRSLEQPTYLLIGHSDGEYRVLVEP